MGSVQFNKDKIEKAVSKIKSGTKTLENAKNKLSRIDFPDDFSYSSKLKNYNGDASKIKDSFTDFAIWLTNQSDEYDKIMKKAVNNVYSTPVIPKIKFMKNHTLVGQRKRSGSGRDIEDSEPDPYEGMPGTPYYQSNHPPTVYLRVTEDGQRYFSIYSEEQTQENWENANIIEKFLRRIGDAFFSGFFGSLVSLSDGVCTLLSNIPGEIGAQFAKYVKDGQGGNVISIMEDESGSKYLPDGPLKNILDMVGGTLGAITIDAILIETGTLGIASLEVVQNVEIIKDGVTYTYTFIKNIGEYSEFAYDENGNIDLTSDEVRGQMSLDAVEFAIENLMIDVITNNALDVIDLPKGSLKEKLKKFAINAGASAGHATVNAIYKSTMTEQEFIDMFFSGDSAELTLYTYLFDPTLNAWRIFFEGVEVANVNIVN